MNRPKHIALAILAALYALSAPIFAQSTRPLLIDTSGTNKGKMEPIAITANSGTSADQFANGATTQAALDGSAEDDRLFYDDFQRADTADNDIGLSQTGIPWVINGSGSANARIINRMITSNLDTAGAVYFWPDVDWPVSSWGFNLNLESLGGGGSWSWATGMTALDHSVSGNMIHIVGSQSAMLVEIWSGSIQSIWSATFSPTLSANRNYPFRFDVNPSNDTITVHAPTGEVAIITHPLISDIHSKNVFVETASSGTSQAKSRYSRVWATGSSSPKAMAAASIAASWNITTPAENLTTISITGNITTSGGLISANSGSNGSHSLSQARFGSIGGVMFSSHQSYSDLNTAGFQQNASGNSYMTSAAAGGLRIGTAWKMFYTGSNFQFGGTGSNYAYIGSIHSGTATLNVSSLAASTAHEQLIPVAGAVSTGTPAISLGFSGTLPLGLLLGGSRVSASGTVGVTLYNSTGSPITDTSTVIRATVIQP